VDESPVALPLTDESTTIVCDVVLTLNVTSPPAEAGDTAAKRPNPNAETATSATRLSVVFVDIDFLSLVVKKTFSSTAGKELFLAS
jgi:hypothetical protein